MKLLCLGDVAISSNEQQITLLSLPDGINLDEETKILFNWEVPIGNQVNPIPRECGGKRIITSHQSVEFIKHWSPGFTSLATNHILDACEFGVEETISKLQEIGFETVGAGLTSFEISQPIFWKTKDGELAIVNWVFPETNPDWQKIPGPNCWPGIEHAQKIIMDLKQKSDFVLAFIHWGNELFPYPRPEERKIAKMLAESGTDIIIGHHPHVVRGMEMFGSCHVFYSLGNYFFSDFNNYLIDNGEDWAPKNKESICVEISFQSGFDPKCKIHAFQQIENKVIIDQKQRSIKSLEKYSKPFHQNIENEYTSWYARKFYQFSKFFIWWDFGIRRLGIKGLLNYITKKTKSFIGFR